MTEELFIYLLFTQYYVLSQWHVEMSLCGCTQYEKGCYFESLNKLSVPVKA